MSVDEFLDEAGVASKSNGIEKLGCQFGIVLGQHANGVTGLIGEAGIAGGQLDVPGCTRRTGAVKVRQRRDFGDEGIFGGEQRLVVKRSPGRLEINMDDGGGFGRLKRFEGRLCPRSGGLGEIEIEVDAISRALGAQCFEAGIDGFADSAELSVGGIAERENGEIQPVEARGVVGHQALVEIDGALGRLAFAPGRDVDDDVLGFDQSCHRNIGHVVDFGVKPHFLGGFACLQGKPF